MKIVEKNAGTKIDFEVSGTKITFADELMLNLAKLQKESQSIRISVLMMMEIL